MVSVLRREPVAAVRDTAALEIFRHQWQLYRKFLVHDYLSNAGAYAELHRFLMQDVGRPFEFVDLACGDASGVVTALKDTPISHYRGIDLAPPALDLARSNLEQLHCPVTLEHADFVTAMQSEARGADIVWISLSLHHLVTPDKRDFMREIRNSLGESGALLIYEPTRWDGEDRTAFLDRFEMIARREWTGLSDDERDDAMRHVRTCDLPETVSGWVALGIEAGFTRIAERYRSHDDLFRMFSYQV